MSKIVEPPVLMSRILTFVLAASVVVLAVLVFVLIKMIPLERPEVFFLVNPTRAVNVAIEPFNPDANNKSAINTYERGFIREYVIARNELDANTNVTRSNWKNIVKPWSDDRVYNAFTKTKLYKDYAFGGKVSGTTCSVAFSNQNGSDAIINTNPGDYTVHFTWICKNISGQPTTKNYKIRIKIKSELDKKVSETFENLEKLKANPLGIHVTEYKVQDGDVDPLNSDITSM